MKIDFDKGDGLVPAIIQDCDTGVVLMLGYMNQEALDKTTTEKKVTFYSRSKQRLWTKGESSGNFLNLQDIKVDCDNDTLLLKVRPEGPTCHSGTDSCFAETNSKAENFLRYLGELIHDRKVNPQPESYTSSLFEKGIKRTAQKVGEEAVELVIESQGSNQELFLEEAADLLFHLMVLLENKDLHLEEVIEVLKGRHKK